MFRTINTEHGQICYELQRKRVKNLNLRVREDGSVHVSIPYSVSYASADRFVENNSRFVFRSIEKAKGRIKGENLDHTFYLGQRLEIRTEISCKTGGALQGNLLTLQVKGDGENERRAALEKWRKNQCESLFPQICRAAYERFCRAELKISFPTISIRTMKTRWGSCTASKGKITLNSLLIEKPCQCIEYVAVHELAHFLVQNHSADFYRVMDAVMPEHRDIKKLLQSK